MPEKIQVLAVDDMPINLMILKRCLDDGFFDVDCCQSAAEFLDKFKRASYDVLLMDIIMPGIDGFELRSLVRQYDMEIPVIFLTTMMEDSNMTLLNQITGDARSYYVNKNQLKEQLVPKINEAVALCRERRSEMVYRQNIESELQLAGQLQKYLLPDWCIQDEFVTLSCCYSPLMHVSGDIFELFPLSDSRYLLFVGDIAGHGVSAALYVATVQMILRMKVRELYGDFSVNAVLSELNRFFCDELHSRIYMTAMAAVFDFGNNHLTLQSAGHLPMQISPPGGRPFSIDDSCGGVPLGMFSESEYPAENNYEYDFEDDTVFFAFTDGICDMVREDDIPVSIEELQEIIASLLPDSDVVSLPFRVKSSLMQMGYDKVSDDITLVALQKRCFREHRRSCLLRREHELDRAAEELASAVSSPELRDTVRRCVLEGGGHVCKLKPESGTVYLSMDITPENIVVRTLKNCSGYAGGALPASELSRLTSSTYGGLLEMCYFLKEGAHE